MLTGLRLGNFKAFAETQRIPIKPITLIFGANSAGKSSLIHSLALAHHAMESGNLDVYRTTIGGESIDLGGFRQYVHKGETERRVEWGADLDVARLTGRLAELLAPIGTVNVSVTIGVRHVERTKKQTIKNDEGVAVTIEVPTDEKPIPQGKPFVSTFEITGDGKSILRASRRPDGNLQLDRMDHEHAVFREVIKAIVETATTTEALWPSDFEVAKKAISELVPEIKIHPGNFLPDGLPRSEEFQGTAGLLSFFPISRGQREEGLASAVRLYIPRTLDELIRGLTGVLREEFSRLSYLGPLRSYPPRHLAFAEHYDPNWFAGGGYAWDKVRNDEDLRIRVNNWLSSEDRLQTRYRIEVRKLFDSDEIREPVGDQAFEIHAGASRLMLHLLEVGMMDAELSEEQRNVIWNTVQLEQGNLGPIEDIPAEFRGRDEFDEVVAKATEGLEAVNELSLIDLSTNTKVSHRDVGIGVSQVLPVLVSAYASRKRIMAIEQPEIHLHPALQAELGDLFIESALGESQNTYIIETHSEHLILRILRRIRETADRELAEGLTPIRSADVQVIYAKPSPTGTVLHLLEITDEGEFADRWPDGFFAERAKELF